MKNSAIIVKVITGSTREGRFSDQAAAWIVQELEKREGVSSEMLDLRDYPMPFFDSPVSPAYKQEPYPHEAVERFTEKIGEADAFVMVTPEYNHGTSGVLKNALDWVYNEWNDKPVAFVAYGSAGGTRAVEQLRLNAIELEMAPIRVAVHFSGADYFPVKMGKAKAEDLFAKYLPKAEVMIEQLLKWTRLFKSLRQEGT